MKQVGHAINSAGGVISCFQQSWEFEEFFVSYFRRTRPFWEKPPQTYITNSGALGRQVANIESAARSLHPAHSFVGIGQIVIAILIFSSLSP